MNDYTYNMHCAAARRHLYRYLSKTPPGTLLNSGKHAEHIYQEKSSRESTRIQQILLGTNTRVMNSHICRQEISPSEGTTPARCMIHLCKKYWKSNEFAHLATTNWPSAGKSAFNYMNPAKTLEIVGKSNAFAHLSMTNQLVRKTPPPDAVRIMHNHLWKSCKIIGKRNVFAHLS